MKDEMQYKLDVLLSMTENIQDYIDIISEDEITRESLSLKVAFNMILCACPYHEEDDTTSISEEIIKNRMDILKGAFDEYFKEGKFKHNEQ
jgi:hypothetical protein